VNSLFRRREENGRDEGLVQGFVSWSRGGEQPSEVAMGWALIGPSEDRGTVLCGLGVGPRNVHKVYSWTDPIPIRDDRLGSKLETIQDMDNQNLIIRRSEVERGINGIRWSGLSIYNSKWII
jgi:hypothetical protein